MDNGMKKYSKFITGLFLIAAILAGSISSRPMETLAADSGTMEVHFLDVGQGNSTLITCDGHSMLIDAGEDSKGTLIQNYLNKQKVESLDYLVLTHPDSDHIGGAPVIISKFKINKVFVSNYEKDNKTYQKLIQSLDNKRLKSVTPDVGAQYTLGKATITFLAPNDEYDNPNDSSVALLVQNGENRFLFTGDAQEAAEKDILATGLDISADVYLAGHHGSRTSTCEDFFEAVNPSCAVISCEEGNSYGHPHAQTLNTFRTNRVKVYRTDEDGTIIATSDGKNITFNARLRNLESRRAHPERFVLHRTDFFCRDICSVKELRRCPGFRRPGRRSCRGCRYCAAAPNPGRSPSCVRNPAGAPKPGAPGPYLCFKCKDKKVSSSLLQLSAYHQPAGFH